MYAGNHPDVVLAQDVAAGAHMYTTLPTFNPDSYMPANQVAQLLLTMVHNRKRTC